MLKRSLVFLGLSIYSCGQPDTPEIHRVDLIIYGGTASAVVAKQAFGDLSAGGLVGLLQNQLAKILSSQTPFAILP